MRGPKKKICDKLQLSSPIYYNISRSPQQSLTFEPLKDLSNYNERYGFKHIIDFEFFLSHSLVSVAIGNTLASLLL
jgi:hypothetical protein